MPFCPSCGSQSSGTFCTSCGRPIPSAPAVSPAPPPVAPQAPIAAAPAKKSNVLLWVLVAVAGLFLLLGLAVVGGGLFLAHKVHQAGLDPDLLRSNPALAMGKMITTMNPDLEVLNVDEGRGVIIVKDKKTGKTLTMNFEDAKRGKFSFQEDGKEAVTLETDEKSGGVHMRSAEGTVDIGASAKVPSWIPVYPGSSPQGTFAANTDKGEGGTASFLTKDAPDKVTQYYEDQFKSSGYKIQMNMKQENGGMLTAVQGNKTLNVVINKNGDGTSVGITYATK